MYYCVFTGSEKSDDVIRQQYAFHLFIEKIQTLSMTRREMNILRNHIFSHGGFPTFNETTYLTRKIGQEAVNKIAKIFNAIVEEIPETLFVKPCRWAYKNALWSMPKRSLNYREDLGYKGTEDQHARVSLFYRNLIDLSPGDQWTLATDTEMQDLAARGFNLECYGSAFNTRLKYFGSISDLDEPYGRIGPALEILDTIAAKKPLMWRTEVVNNGKDIIRFTVNPPSGKHGLYETIERIIKILEIRKAEIMLYVPTSFATLAADSHFSKIKEFVAKRRTANIGWSLDGKHERKDLTQRSWQIFHLKS